MSTHSPVARASMPKAFPGSLLDRRRVGLAGLVLIPILAVVLMSMTAGRASAFGINVEAETKLGDRLWLAKKLRKNRHAKLRQGIHERITREALEAAAGRRDLKVALSSKQRQQVVYGLLFNDDPAGYLFPQSDANPKGYRITRDSGVSIVNGIKWLERFGRVVADLKRLAVLSKAEASERLASVSVVRRRSGREIPQIEDRLEDDILWASHFGDLQYLHAMGLAHESREEILGRMRGYSEHVWSIVTGSLTLSCLVDQVQQAKADDFGRGTVAASCPATNPAHAARKRQLMIRFDEADALYHTKDAEEIRLRALGSLIHMVQDSYAKGHTVREGWDGDNSGRILYFQNYAEQDGAEHGKFDTHETKDVDKWDRIPGALMAMERSATIVAFYALQCGWKPGPRDAMGCPAKGVEGYLFDDVFAVSNAVDLDTSTRAHEKMRVHE